MSKRPFVIGLTGSIGMGKTETGKMFVRLGIPVHDADAQVHALYDAGGAAVAPVEAAFPGTVRQGRVDRSALANAVMGEEAAFRRLEAIVHPLTAQARARFVDEAGKSGADLVVVDIPLLFEAGLQEEVDAIVVVSASAEVQRDRVLKRPGMTPEKLETLSARQIPDKEKRAKADFVIETGEGLDHAFAQVEELIRRLREQLAGAPKK